MECMRNMERFGQNGKPEGDVTEWAVCRPGC